MFDPWTGSRFGNNDNVLKGIRLLILGESHYTENAEWVGKTAPSDTKDVIESLAIQDRYKFFSKVAHLATGEKTETWTDDRNRDFWHAVAFYNYIPVYLSKGGRPDPTTWRSGREPLQAVLTNIKPEGVIVCGIGLWWWVMDAQPGGVASNPPDRDIAPVGPGIGVRIPHLTGARGASRYSYDVSRPLVERMMFDIRERKPGPV